MASLVLVAAFLANAWVSFARIVLDGEQYDDSYITYRYAVNLAEGRGLTFNTYERINSASSLLYAAILAGCYRTGAKQLGVVGALLNTLAGCVGLVLAFLLCRWVSRSTLVAGLVLLPLALSGAWAGWAASGMETILYACLVITTFYFLARGQVARCMTFLVLSLLCRPEAVILLVAIVGGHWLARMPKLAFTYAIAGAVTLCVVYAFHFAYYGDWVPHPVMMKGVARYYSPGPVQQLRDVARLFVLGFGGVTVAAIISLGAQIQSTLTRPAGWRDLTAFQFTLALYLGLSSVSLLLGPRSDMTRYGVHLLPLVCVVAAQGWTLIPRSRASIGAAALIVFAAVSCFLARRDLHATKDAFERWAAHQRARKELGAWINHNVPAGAVILSSDLGMIAYVAKEYDFYDVLGLLTRTPVVGARNHDWSGVVRDVAKVAPAYAADTVPPDGRLQALDILARPDRFFRDIEPPDRVQVVDEEMVGIRAERYRFVVARLHWPT